MPAAGTGRFTSHGASHQAPGAQHGTPMVSALAAALPQAQGDKGASSPQGIRHHGPAGFLLLPKLYGFTSSKPTATWTAMGMAALVGQAQGNLTAAHCQRTGVLPYSFPTSVHQFVPPTEFIYMYVHLRPSLASDPSRPLQYAKGCMVMGTQHRQALPSLWCCCMKLKEDSAEIACTSASMLSLLIYLENIAQVPIQQRKRRLDMVCANCIAIAGSFVHGEVGVKPSLLMRECDKGQ